MDHVVATKKLSWVYIITACVVIICIGQAVWIFRHIQQDQAQAAAPLAAGISPTHDAAEQAATNSINPRIVAQAYLKTALQLELISTNYQHIFDSYTLAIEQDPSYAEAYLYRSKIAALLGKHEIARQDREQGFALELSSAQRNYHLGRLASDPNEKIEYLKQALWDDASLGQAYYERGLAYLQLGETELAIEAFSNAIVADNRHAASYYQRALQYQALGLPGQMLSDLQRAVQVEPRFADAWNVLSIEYEFHMQPDKAIAAASQAISLYEMFGMDSKAASEHRANLEFKYPEAKQSKAVTDLDTTITNNPSDFASYYQRAQIHYLQQHYQAAIEDLTIYLEHNPLEEAYLVRALSYEQLGMYHLAVADLEQAQHNAEAIGKPWTSDALIAKKLQELRVKQASGF